MASNRDRITVDITNTGIREKLMAQTSDPNASIGSLVRAATLTAIELLEAIDKLELSQPKPGKIYEWLLALSGKDYKNVTKLTIAQIVAGCDKVELEDRTGISRNRLEAIASGMKPLMPELSLLELGLDVSLEELYAIYQRDFPDSSCKKGNKEPNGV